MLTMQLTRPAQLILNGITNGVMNLIPAKKSLRVKLGQGKLVSINSSNRKGINGLRPLFSLSGTSGSINHELEDDIIQKASGALGHQMWTVHKRAGFTGITFAVNCVSTIYRAWTNFESVDQHMVC